MTQKELLKAALPVLKNAQALFRAGRPEGAERIDVPMLPGWDGVGEVLGMKAVPTKFLRVPRLVAGDYEEYVFGIMSVEGSEGQLWEKP